MKHFAAILVTLFSASAMLYSASQPDIMLTTFSGYDQQKSIVATLGASVSSDGILQKFRITSVLIPHGRPADSKSVGQTIDSAHFAPIAAAFKSYRSDNNVEKRNILWQTMRGLGYPPEEFDLPKSPDEAKEEAESVQGPEVDYI